MPRDVTPIELGIEVGTMVRVTRDGRSYIATTTDKVDVTDKLESYIKKNAFRAKKALRLDETKGGGTRWSHVSDSEFERKSRGIEVNATDNDNLYIHGKHYTPEGFDSQEDIIEFIAHAIEVKPPKLKIPELSWRFGIRSAIRGENILTTGPSGCGKTLFAKSIAVALGREDKFYYVNLGATQDPRSTLIGNTHYNPDKGTFVSLSYFAEAIQVPQAIILLDEISRAHPDAHNILMTVLDATQRYLRVDEKADTETISVAPGVSFILTANIGAQYSATRAIDRALLDRCTLFEMHPLSRDDELDNLSASYPTVPVDMLGRIADIAHTTREEIKSDMPRIDDIISTRMCERMAFMMWDGFSLADAAEVCVYPYFSDAGGTDSPRSFVRALVQRYLPTQFDGKENVTTNDVNNTTDKPWR